MAEAASGGGGGTGITEKKLAIHSFMNFSTDTTMANYGDIDFNAPCFSISYSGMGYAVGNSVNGNILLYGENLTTGTASGMRLASEVVGHSYLGGASGLTSHVFVEMLLALGASIGTVSIQGATSFVTAQTNPKNFRLEGVCFSQSLSLFCAVGFPDGVDAYIVTSPDGITWTERANPLNKFLKAVTFSESLGLFCAVGGDVVVGNFYCITSPDGITWTSRVAGIGNYLNCVIWCEALGFFIAWGNDLTNQKCRTSPDGITWSAAAQINNVANILSIQYSEEYGIFIAGGEGTFYMSDDGSNWTEIPISISCF